ncbi:hypothetical protein [Bacillus sp. CECT 9360]|nr:hypothetical protein [Bacillus sp. CECT 9360]CAH0344108.1 hypothetical protein BCI9360_00339 [Bacillus sp. CECT 9360]
MRKCEVCGREEDMNGTEELVGISHLHICETCQTDRYLEPLE